MTRSMLNAHGHGAKMMATPRRRSDRPNVSAHTANTIFLWKVQELVGLAVDVAAPTPPGSDLRVAQSTPQTSTVPAWMPSILLPTVMPQAGQIPTHDRTKTENFPHAE